MESDGHTTASPTQGSEADQSSAGKINILPLPPSDGRLRDVIALGKRARARLGFLPDQVYEQAAAHGTLVVAVDSTDSVVGYALFGLPGSLVRLDHLCVATTFRRSGVGRALIEWMSEAHQHRQGIRLKCRQDYGLAHMWERLGFRPLDEVPGRGRQRLPLVVWMRSHGHLDLFTTAVEAELTAAIDYDVFQDLHDEPPQAGADESRALTADHLHGRLLLIVTNALYQEIHSVKDNRRRRRYIEAASTYPHPPTESDQIEHLTDTLLKAVQQSVPPRPSSDLDMKMARRVATAAAAGATVLVTKQPALAGAFGEAAIAALGVKILTPTETIVRVDELARAEQYQPAALLGTGYQAAEVGHDTEQLDRFAQSTVGESPDDLLQRLRGFAQLPQKWHRRIVRDPRGEPVAIYVHGDEADHYAVPLLRVHAGRLGSSLASQILFQLREASLGTGHTTFLITDPFLPPWINRTAQLDGMTPTNNGLLGFTIDCCGAAIQVASASQANAPATDHIPSLQTGLAAHAAAIAERTLWPAKITDSALPTYVIPIQPRWSAELFHVPAGLYDRPADLGLSREHVYYRSPHGPRISAPARILWYLSKGSPDWPYARIFACSQLDEVVVATPADLHQRFRHLGVWQLAQITASARNGQAQALRFTNTEPLPNPVSRSKLDHLSARFGQTLQLQSLRKIAPPLFEAIYREGRPSSDCP